MSSFYGEDLGVAGQGGGAESEMAEEARGEQQGADEEDEEEERDKQLHIVASAEKDTTDKDGAAKREASPEFLAY